MTLTNTFKTTTLEGQKSFSFKVKGNETFVKNDEEI